MGKSWVLLGSSTPFFVLMRLDAASIECELIVSVEFLVACGVVSKCIELEYCVEKKYIYIHIFFVCFLFKALQ